MAVSTIERQSKLFRRPDFVYNSYQELISGINNNEIFVEALWNPKLLSDAPSDSMPVGFYTIFGIGSYDIRYKKLFIISSKSMWIGVVDSNNALAWTKAF